MDFFLGSVKLDNEGIKKSQLSGKSAKLIRRKIKREHRRSREKALCNTDFYVSNVASRTATNTTQCDFLKRGEVKVRSKQIEQVTIKHAKIGSGVHKRFDFERSVVIAQGERKKRAGKFTESDGLVGKGMYHTKLANMRQIVLWHFEKNRFFVAFFDRFFVGFFCAFTGTNHAICVG